MSVETQVQPMTPSASLILMLEHSEHHIVSVYFISGRTKAVRLRSASFFEMPMLITTVSVKVLLSR